MVLYGITLDSLEEELRDADPILLPTFYTNDAVFDSSSQRSAAQLIPMMDRGTDWGYFPDPAKSIFIADNPEEKEATNREFERVGLNINYIDGGCYLGAYLGPREELEEWARPKVEAWAHRVSILAKIANRNPQSAYAGLGMLLQIK